MALLRVEPHRLVAVSLGLLCVVVASADPSVAPSLVEAPFLRENSAAMKTMMAGMAIKPSGNVDRDFAEMMIAHHQGAIDMARAELRYGRDEQLRRIAQGIVVEQQQEIAAMRLALEGPLSPAVAAEARPGASGP